MKRILFFLAIASIFVACVDKQNDGTKPNPDPITIIKYADCNCGDQDYGDVATRLAEDGQVICDLCMYTGIESYHVISANDFNGMVTKFWGSNTPLYKSETWANLYGMVNQYCYERHLKITYDAEAASVSDIEFTIYQFNNTPNIGECYYSAPFIKGMGLKHDLCSGGSIEFTKGLSDNRVVVLIKVTDIKNNVFYYDITQDPKKKLFELI